MKRNTKFLILFLVVAALAILPACKSSTAQSNTQKGPQDDTANTSVTPNAPARTYPLPQNILDSEMKKLDGSTVKISDFKGKVLIVNQWATWCGPCRMEIPELIKLREEFKDRDFEVIGITIEDDRGNIEPAIKAYVERQQIPYPIIMANDEVWEEFAGITGRGVIPQSFVLNRNGEVTAAFAGFSPHRTPQNVRKAVEDALNNP